MYSYLRKIRGVRNARLASYLPAVLLSGRCVREGCKGERQGGRKGGRDGGREREVRHHATGVDLDARDNKSIFVSKENNVISYLYTI